MNSDLKASALTYKNWFIEEALPLWGGVAINPKTGGSVERLHSNGAPDFDCNVRVRVQARQIFVFCLAHELAWFPRSQQIVEGLNQFVQLCGRHPSGQGYAHLLGADNQVIDSKQDLYDHAFHLLAQIWQFRCFKKEECLQEAKNIVSFIEKNLSSSNGGWIEGLYPYNHRRQNPHMHLFEAFIAGYEATNDSFWLDYAHRMFELFEKHFYDKTHRVLLEFFSEDWRPVETTVEPGHMMEWVWLLRKYSELSAVDVNDYANNLYDSAIKYGLTESGLLYDEVNLDGSLKKGSKRCWPMTELIKASIAQAEAGEIDCEKIAVRALEDLKKHYLTVSTPGSYVDQLDDSDALVADVAPASTLYHLIVAAAEVTRYCKV